MQKPNGNIEIYGFSCSLGGILIGGWIDFSWNDPIDPPSVTVQMDREAVTGPGLLCLFPRDDVRKRGLGFLLLVETEAMPRGTLLEATLHAAGQSFSLLPSENVETYGEERLFKHAKHFIAAAPANEKRTAFRELLNRPCFTGADTLPGYAWPIHLETDKFYFCPPKGLAIRGWFLDPFGRVAEIRLCCGGARQRIDPATWIPIRRRDVAESFTAKYGTVDERCGFLTYVSDLYVVGQPLFFEIEMVDGTVAFRPVPAAAPMTGIVGMKELLSSFDLRREALARGYDHVVGPAVTAMNASRLAQGPQVVEIPFGAQPAAPRCSVIVPLYGRVDFLEYQLAFFSGTLSPDHEILYVLDDPDRSAETESLAASSYARFQRPFRLLVLGHNVGFAPANNIGLARARGEYICFLNSDVFPDNPDWLECMIETSRAVPDVGIVGAHLVYEDGSLQHDGCAFERLPEFGNWPFPMHAGKGRLVEKLEDVAEASVVTGACMVLKRDLARELGGFDEGYAIGDFEDADLCMKITDRGLRCVVDNRAKLFHLERQSQGNQGQSWRMNLTLFNAWRFQTRWNHREL